MQERGDGSVRPEAVLAVLLIISVLLIIFTGRSGAREESGWGTQLVGGVQRFFGSATQRVKDGFGSLRRLREMRVQYEAALQELGEYRGLERNIVELRRENDELRRQLGYSASMDSEHLAARVIGGDPSNLFASLTIDKGIEDGVRSGMVVTAYQDGFFGLLGKVVSVSKRSALVRPLEDPDQYVAARLQESRYEGLVEGRGNENGDLVMRYVRKSAGSFIGINDLVVTSGMQSLYPAGIVIGRVKEVRSRDYSASLELILEPVIDRSRIEYVFVLKVES